MVLEFEPCRIRIYVYEFSPDSRYLAYFGTNHRAMTFKDRPPPEVLAERKVEPPFRLWDVVENRELRHAVRGSWHWRMLGFTSDSKKVIVRTPEEILVTDFRTGEIHAWDRLQPAITVFDPFSHLGAGGEVNIVPSPGKAFQSRRKVVAFLQQSLVE